MYKFSRKQKIQTTVYFCCVAVCYWRGIPLLEMWSEEERCAHLAHSPSIWWTSATNAWDCMEHSDSLFDHLRVFTRRWYSLTCVNRTLPIGSWPDLTRRQPLLRWPRKVAQVEFSLSNVWTSLWHALFLSYLWEYRHNPCINCRWPDSLAYISWCRRCESNFNDGDVIGPRSCRIWWYNAKLEKDAIVNWSPHDGAPVVLGCFWSNWHYACAKISEFPVKILTPPLVLTTPISYMVRIFWRSVDIYHDIWP